MERSRTAVVVGTGPSLSLEQLDALHASNLPSLSCNRIHLIFDKTVWRPDGVVINELDDMPDIIPDLHVYMKHKIHVHMRATDARRIAAQYPHRFQWY